MADVIVSGDNADETVTDERATLGRDALGVNGVVKLSLGRKKHVLLKAV